MSQPSGPRPSLDVRGAVDLSTLGRPAAPPPAPDGGARGTWVVDVTEDDFAAVVQQSTQVPVVLSLWAPHDQASSRVTATLGQVVDELGGRVLLGRVDVEQSPQVAQAISAQARATVVAVVQGQAVPLPPLEQAAPEQVRAVLDQVLQMAAANGVDGRLPGGEPGPEEPQEPEEEPLPPIHQAAVDAIDRGDLAAAADAFGQALAQDPRDDDARAGLAQVELMLRTSEVDARAARDAAAAAPQDVAAQLVVADLDLVAGQVEDAFARLIDVVRVSRGEDRERARLRLVTLFTVVGDADPRVAAARRALASALY
jgi:putative thioredoxin